MARSPAGSGIHAGSAPFEAGGEIHTASTGDVSGYTTDKVVKALGGDPDRKPDPASAKCPPGSALSSLKYGLKLQTAPVKKERTDVPGLNVYYTCRIVDLDARAPCTSETTPLTKHFLANPADTLGRAESKHPTINCGPNRVITELAFKRSKDKENVSVGVSILASMSLRVQLGSAARRARQRR